MNVTDHRLHGDERTEVPFAASPNLGAALEPRYLVMHYTSGGSARSAVSWLCNEDARASAHLVIGRDGSVTQLVPFDRVAWHAGPSRWEGITGLNHHSIGIELDNAGRLQRQGGSWRAWFGKVYPDEDVMEAVHRHEATPCGWHLFTREQLDATLRVAEAILRAYPGIRDILGHDDISPGRKVDPGPAFPMESIRARLFGRAEDRMPSFATITALNIRRGPGTRHDTLPLSPLPTGTRLDVLREQGSWCLVDVVDEVAGAQDVQGWVHGRYIQRVE
jgi:N-acetylmuramoyl-L-alanine amidase